MENLVVEKYFVENFAAKNFEVNKGFGCTFEQEWK